MLKRVQWNADAQPYGQTLDRVLYDLRRADPGNLLLDAVSMADILEDSDGVMLLDAMTTPFSQLPHMMAMLKTGMEHFSATVKPLDVTISEPFSARGVANVSAIFSLSDGQNLSVYFHNPDTKPKSIGANDEMISWKWMLNKLDVTIVVAPERGKELNIREVARRIMKLAEKNSAAFQRANGKRAERMKKIEGLKEEVAALEVELAKAQKDLEVAKLVAEELAIKAVEADRYLPPGWSGLPGGIATSTDPVSGGIVDKEVVSGKWFYIAENSAINKGTGFNTRAEALAALEAQVQAVAKAGNELPVMDVSVVKAKEGLSLQIKDAVEKSLQSLAGVVETSDNRRERNSLGDGAMAAMKRLKLVKRGNEIRALLGMNAAVAKPPEPQATGTVQPTEADGMQATTPEPKPEEQNPHVKALQDLAAGKNDSQGLEWMFNIIQGAIDGLEEVNQLTGDNEAAANAAITHWAEFEERLNG